MRFIVMFVTVCMLFLINVNKRYSKNYSINYVDCLRLLQFVALK